MDQRAYDLGKYAERWFGAVPSEHYGWWKVSTPFWHVFIINTHEIWSIVLAPTNRITSKLKDVHFIDQNVSGLFLCPSLDAGSPPIIWTKSTNQQIQSTQLTNPPRMLRQYATIPMAMYIISECPHDPNKYTFMNFTLFMKLFNNHLRLESLLPVPGVASIWWTYRIWPRIVCRLRSMRMAFNRRSCISAGIRSTRMWLPLAPKREE